MLVLNHLMPIDRHLTALLGRPGKWLSIFITFQIVCFGWILFRAHTTTIMPLLHSIVTLFRADNMQHFFHSRATEPFRMYGQGLIALAAVTLATDYLGYRKGGEFPDLFKTMNPYAGAALAVACYLAVMLLGKRESAQFIYFQF
jgi:alginate O-acetyltransferase complex protein AlgI